MNRWRTGRVLLGVILLCTAVSQGQDAALLTGRLFAPMELRWRPVIASSPLPGWANSPVDATAGSAIFPIPAAWERTGIDRFVVTVVFEDTTDTGPILEWRSRSGDVSRLSEGLGEHDGSLGLHARSLLIPEDLTRQGGAVVVSMPWRPDGLIRASVEPARDVTVAVLGSTLQPGAIDRAGIIHEIDDLAGVDPGPVTGDSRSGAIVEAELAAGIEPLTDELEFEVPVDGTVEGGVLKTEIVGLDPGSRVFVWLNGLYQGELNSAAFRLDDAAVTVGSDGRLQIAGWRAHNLFLPGKAWKKGLNRVLLRLRRSEGDSGLPVSLKHTNLHLRFSPDDAGTLNSIEVQPPGTLEVPMTATETPATAALDGNPDFSVDVGLVQEPPPVPVVVTTPPATRKKPTPPPSVVVTLPQPATVETPPPAGLLEGELPVEH